MGRIGRAAWGGMERGFGVERGYGTWRGLKGQRYAMLEGSEMAIQEPADPPHVHARQKRSSLPFRGSGASTCSISMVSVVGRGACSIRMVSVVVVVVVF